jgi:hypothetical protein
MLRLTVVLGLALDLAPYAERAPGHWRLCRYMIELHADRRNVSLRCLAETEAHLESPEAGGPYYNVIAQYVPQYRHQAEYHARRQGRWNSVAFQPWRSLRSELDADLKDQPADAIWRVLQYGFPSGLDAPNY